MVGIWDDPQDELESESGVRPNSTGLYDWYTRATQGQGQPATDLYSGSVAQKNQAADAYYQTAKTRLQGLSSQIPGFTDRGEMGRLNTYLDFFGPQSLYNMGPGAYSAGQATPGYVQSLYTDFPFLDPTWNSSKGAGISASGLSKLQMGGGLTTSTVTGPDGIQRDQWGNPTGYNFTNPNAGLGGLSIQQLLGGMGGQARGALSDYFGPNGAGADLFNPTIVIPDLPGLADLQKLVGDASGLNLAGQTGGLQQALDRLLTNQAGGLSTSLTGSLGTAGGLQQALSKLLSGDMAGLTSGIGGLNTQVGSLQNRLNSFNLPELGSLNSLIQQVSRLSVPNFTGLSTGIGDLTSLVGNRANNTGLSGILAALQGQASGLSTQLGSLKTPDLTQLNTLLGQIPGLTDLLGPNGLKGLAGELSTQTQRLQSINPTASIDTASLRSALSDPTVRGLLGGGGGFSAESLLGALGDKDVAEALQRLLPGGTTVNNITGGTGLPPNWWQGDTSNSLQGWLNQQLWGIESKLGNEFNPETLTQSEFEDYLFGGLRPERYPGETGGALPNGFNFEGFQTGINELISGKIDPLSSKLNDLLDRIGANVGGLNGGGDGGVGGGPPGSGGNIWENMPPEISNYIKEMTKLLGGGAPEDYGLGDMPGAGNVDTAGQEPSGNAWQNILQNMGGPPTVEVPEYVDYTDWLRQPLMEALTGDLNAANPYDTRMNQILGGQMGDLDKELKDNMRLIENRFAVSDRLGSGEYTKAVQDAIDNVGRRKDLIRSSFGQSAAAADSSLRDSRLSRLSMGVTDEFNRGQTTIGNYTALQNNANTQYNDWLKNYSDAYWRPKTEADKGLALILQGMNPNGPDMGLVGQLLSGVSSSAAESSSGVNAGLGAILSQILKNDSGNQGG